MRRLWKCRFNLILIIRANAVECYESDLVEDIEIVEVALVEYEFEQERRRVHVH